MNDARLMNPDGTCALCGHTATEHTQGCSECDCELVAEAAKEPKDNEGIGHTIDVRFGLRLRRP